MNFSGVPRTLSALLVFAALTTGCWPPGASPQDEVKDPYYLVGMNRVTGKDPQGAMEAFRHALENNPNSSAAHFQLAVLKEQHEKNFPAAIYHYERCITDNLSPQRADMIRQRISLCTQELIKKSGNFLTPPTQQAEIDELKKRLAQAHAENDSLRRQLETALARAGRDFVVVSNRALFPSPPRATNAVENPGPPRPGTGRPPDHSALRTHKVKVGENPSTIAKQYAISLNSLMKANPTLDPKRIRVGQTINLPPEARP